MQLSVNGNIRLYNGVSFDAILTIEVAGENAIIGKIVLVSGCDGYSDDFTGKRINLNNGVIFLPGHNASFAENARQPAVPD